MNKKWILNEDRFEAKTALAYEGLFTIGSGYLHVRGSLEENVEGEPQNITDPRKPIQNASALKPSIKKVKWGTYVPGIFGHHPFLNEELINLPYFIDITPFIDDEKLDIEKCSIHSYQRILNMQTASLHRSFLWKTKSNNNISVKFERFISGARPSICSQRLTLLSENAVTIKIKSGIDADVRTNGFDHFENVSVGQIGLNEIKCTLQTNGGDKVTTHTQLLGPNDGWNYKEEHRRGFFYGTFRIPAKGQIIIEKRTAVVTSRDLKPQKTEEILAGVKSMSYEALFNEHVNFWAERWKKSDIVIEGDDESQKALRCSIYHLLRCHVPGDPRIAIDAKGTAGDIYYGRFFWDTEVYILPFFLYTDPERAKTLVDFRIHTLKGARENAVKYGYKVARYAWESDNYGRECCPVWQYADNEIHITADVVYAFAHYAKAIDLNYLTGPAAKVIVETARYWLDRIDWRPGDSYPSLLGVMGPDEYTPISNNNAYINFMVSFALSIASQVGQKGGATLEECRQFKEVADKLPIMRSKDNKLILQCEEFEKFAEPRFDELWKDHKASFASQITQERIYRSKCLKQADVLMLMFLFYDRFTEEEIKTAWDYYLPYTTHDSSLSAGIHAIIALRLGLEDEAWKMFQQSKGHDLDVYHGGASEGIHIAGCGSNWQMIVFGIAGMRNAIQSDIFTLQPRLPKQWKKLTFPVIWKEHTLQITLEPKKTYIKNNSKLDIEVLCGNEKRLVAAEKEETFLSK